jgi:hypothetical protein
MIWRVVQVNHQREKRDYLALSRNKIHLVMWFTLCGVLSLLVLVCLGLCLRKSLTCLLVGGHLESQRVPQFERWCQHAFFGVFGRKEIIGEDWERSLEDILASFLHTLFLWTVDFVSPLSLSFSDFLNRFSISS